LIAKNKLTEVGVILTWKANFDVGVILTWKENFYFVKYNYKILE